MPVDMDSQSVRLTDFKLRAYRSCKSASFSPDARVTALIGPNGSGKTNILQGLMLLYGTGREYAGFLGDDLFTLESQVSATFLFGKKHVRLRASITYRPSDQNRDEVLYSQEEWNFKEMTGSDEWIALPPHYDKRRAFLRYRRDGRARFVHGYVRGPRGSRVRHLFVPERQLPPRAWQALEAVHDFQSRTVYYSASQFTDPTQCPPSFEIDEDGDLYEQGASSSRSPDHLRFIYQLYRMHKMQENLYATYMSLVDRKGLNLIQKIKWKETKYSTRAYEVRAGSVITKSRKRLLIIPTVYIGDSQLSFAQLSEGTFRTLAILFYVVTDKSRLLLIEEPEVCVHHGLLTSVIDIIREFAREKQIIFSTHSENVLDQLEPEQVRLVSKGKGGTIVSTISRNMSKRQFQALKEYLQTKGSLGEYWRHSGFSE